jgi:hypothetical protein
LNAVFEEEVAKKGILFIMPTKNLFCLFFSLLSSPHKTLSPFMSNTDSSSWWQTAFEVISSSSSFISSIDSGRFTHNPVKSPSKYSAEGRKRGRMIDCSDSSSTSKSSLFDDAMMAADECDTESADKARLFSFGNLTTSDPADEGFLGKIKMSWESGKRFVFSSNDQKDKLTPHPSW